MATAKISVLTPYLERTRYMELNKKLLKNDPRILEFIELKGISPVSKARQILLKKAKGEYVLWIDSDVELKSNPITTLLNYFSDDVAGVCASTIEQDPMYWFDSAITQCLPKVYNKKKCHLNCSLFKTKSLLDIGGFDINLVSAEDNDIQMRLNKAGHKVLGLRNLRVPHHSIHSFEKEKWYFEGYKAIFNKHKFFENECGQVEMFSNRLRFNKFKLWPSKFIIEFLKTNSIELKKRIKLIPDIWYNFLLSHNPELVKPKECGLLITENCIFKCQSCTYWKNKSHDLSIEQLFKIVDNLARFGIKTITLVGGEPLLRKDLMELIIYIKKKNIRCGIITNGFLWKEKLTELLKLDFINVSIDGLEKTHDFLRNKKGAWNKSIDLLFELKKKYHKNVSVSFVLQKKNFREFGFLYEFLTNFEIPLYILCYNTGGMGQPKNLKKGLNPGIIQHILDEHASCLRIEQKEYLNLILNKLLNKQNKNFCLSPNTKLMIDGKGGVCPCSALNKSVGKALNMPLNKIWINYRNLRKQILNKWHPRCTNCVSCELTTNFVKGRAFNAKVLVRFLAKLKLRKQNFSITCLPEYLPMKNFIGKKLKNKKILDLGCGDCSFIELFKIDKKFYKGFDLDEKIVNSAQKKGFNVVQLDLEKSKLTLPRNYFDVVLLKDILEHLNDPLHVMKEAYKVLKKDGMILISVPSEWSQLIWDDYTHKRGFTKRAIYELLRDSKFKIIRKGLYQDLIKFRTSRLKYPMRLLFQKFTGVDLITQGYFIEGKK